ncbi:MAG: hypothetical protein HQ515_15145 [Phycisphaeraceae bacterium]|nr:hypothetical protein [Phycisphaeraceae bacterium]
MSEHTPEQTQIEEFAKQFELTKPSKSLKQDIANSARSTWSSQAETRAHSDSLVPYFGALAATLLMILAVNALSNYAPQARLSEYVVTIRPGETFQLDEETNGKRPYQYRMALCIVSLSDARYKTHAKQLQTLLSQGVSL